MIERPIFHFTPQKNWMNDPNGLVYDRGVWHMFFQYDPISKSSGRRAWGHAVSRDLVRWQELDVALMPDKYEMYSGSGAMDIPNTLGLNTPGRTTMLLAVSEFYNGMCIYYSVDGGNTFAKLGDRTLIPSPDGPDRDPKLFYYDEGKYWVTMFYGEQHARSGVPGYVFFRSRDLLDWEYMSEVPSNYECPDMRLLPVEGSDEKKWTILAGNTDTLVGDFDGRSFAPCQPKDKSLRVYMNYAPQTWSDAPGGRVIQQNWLTGPVDPDTPWTQQMAFPTDLSLRKTPEGYKLLHSPVPEIKSLWQKTFDFGPGELKSGRTGLFDNIEGKALDIEYEYVHAPFSCIVLQTPNGSMEHLGFEPCVRLNNRWETCRLTKDGTMKVRVLIDTDSIEVFAGEGEVYMCFTAARGSAPLALFNHGKPAQLVRARVSLIG
ncbi:MAG: glycoside hydrolase family 32 protein [Abditibacteriota bacterium]|nr:glycoside hydrolase family 32 protein [Abditibacteriota bacterium]